MKEILQTKYLNLKSPVACASAHVNSCTSCRECCSGVRSRWSQRSRSRRPGRAAPGVWSCRPSWRASFRS